MKVTVHRKAHFNAAHRLHNPAWSAERNSTVFGLCNNPLYHGHNYELEVSVRGEVDPDTGFLVDVKTLSNLIKTEVEDRLDHKNLNLEVPEFEHRNPTAEHIAYVIWHYLRPHLRPEWELGIRLYETPRNFVDYHGE